MESVSELLLLHIKRYPRFYPQDAVKLLYQRSFGNAHLVSDACAGLDRIKSELEICPADGPLFEDLGGNQVRLYLGPASALGISADTINRLFLLSAPPIGRPAFQQSIGELRCLCQTGQLPFSPAELDAFLIEFEAAGSPPVSHSGEYRAHYRPAYRLIDRYFIPVLPVLAALDGLLSSGGPVNVAIEGGAATGKSMLGEKLSRLYPCNLFHTDDFFLPSSLRTPDRLAEPGGNIDYDRLREQITSRLGKPIEYQKYNCHTGLLGPPVSVPACRMNIVEGAYSAHPKLGGVYQLKLFIRAEESERRRRIEARNGPTAEEFYSRWMPMEDAYFEKYKTEQSCDFILTWEKP